MRVLVAMSGGVDSSVAAALLRSDGHDVTGATMKLWGGASDSGCCSAADVRDARRAADALGIEHRVFNFTDEFTAHVVEPYVEAHRRAETPNPCAECNRHLKFDAFVARALRLGFDAVATGHYARLLGRRAGAALARAADGAKDQSYVLSMLTAPVLEHLVLPIGGLRKQEVREVARRAGLAVADKPDSQDVCFVPRGQGAREAFVAARIPLHGAEARDVDGEVVGRVPAVELVTVGQRRGLGVPASGERRYVVDVDATRRRVTLGSRGDLLVERYSLERRTWTGAPCPDGASVAVQASAHGATIPARTCADGVVLDRPSRRIAPGQLVALYDGDVVVGSGIVAR